MNLRCQPLNDQEDLVVRLRDEENLTSREIAERLDLSPSRIGQVYRAARTKIEFPSNGLSKTINRLLTKAGIAIQKEAIVQALRTGKLYPNCWPPNYGRYAHRDVCRWVGVDPATLPQDWPDGDRTPYPDDGLSYRAHNILRYAGIPATKESVSQALQTGQLWPNQRPCGYGKVTHAELCRWTGINPFALKSSLTKRISVARVSQV